MNFTRNRIFALWASLPAEKSEEFLTDYREALMDITGGRNGFSEDTLENVYNRLEKKWEIICPLKYD